MDLVTELVFPCVIFIALCITLPPYLIIKFIYCFIIRPFLVEDMKGKVVLVTGASSGIGEQIVYEYARRGAHLVVVARRKNKLEEVAEKAREIGSKDVLVLCGDVTKLEDCKNFIEETIKHFGRLDHLVNNAGITSVCPFEEISNIPNVAPIMNVNFWGSIYATHFAIPYLRKSKGRIVVIGSPSGWLFSPRLSFYAASKAALMNFFDTLRVELDPWVSITIVSPGITESEMTKGNHLGKEGVMQIDEENMNVSFHREVPDNKFRIMCKDNCQRSM